MGKLLNRSFLHTQKKETKIVAGRWELDNRNIFRIKLV